MKLAELIQEVKDATRKVLGKLIDTKPEHFKKNGRYYQNIIIRTLTAYQNLEKNSFPQADFFSFMLWGEYIQLLPVYHLYLKPQHSEISDYINYSSALRIALVRKWLTLDDVDFNEIIPGIDTTILIEICTGMDELIEPALIAGCDPNISEKNEFGNTPLIWAIANNSKNTAKTLIQLCKQHKIELDLNKPSAFNRNTALILCVAKGHNRPNDMPNYELTEFLLTLGADPDCQDANGFTALHYAFLRRDKATVALLIKFKADFSIKNSDGKTPKDMLNSSYDEARNKLYSITNGNDQGSCSFPSASEFNKLKAFFIEYEDGALNDNSSLNIILKPRLFHSHPATKKGEGILPPSFTVK